MVGCPAAFPMRAHTGSVFALWDLLRALPVSVHGNLCSIPMSRGGADHSTLTRKFVNIRYFRWGVHHNTLPSRDRKISYEVHYTCEVRDAFGLE
jgi:hypothetical protein